MSNQEIPSVYGDYNQMLHEQYQKMGSVPPLVADSGVAYHVAHKVNGLLEDASFYYDDHIAAMDIAEDPVGVFEEANYQRKDNILKAISRGEALHRHLAREDFAEGQDHRRFTVIDERFRSRAQGLRDQMAITRMEEQFRDTNGQTGMMRMHKEYEGKPPETPES